MKKKAHKVLFVVLAAGILLIIAIGLMLTMLYKKEQPRLEAVRTLPVLAEWQFKKGILLSEASV